MSRRGTAEEKTAKSDPIYRNRLVNMLVNRILKHGKKSLAYQIIYRAMKKIQQKTETNPLSVYVKQYVDSSILVHGFSWLYGSSGGEIELQEIVNGLINTQMYNSPGISIALISITVGIGFKLSPAPFHQWTPDVYEGVRFVRQIPTSISISEMFGFFKTP
ncbi:hypothetical protein C4D60_Mb00t01240 [Musa balbisiana]|uniref:Small ribosomal subunit protein uS7 domain-containing protein n=1 Tax=Musa balbisiana TaxID=52838 RepID=A0A4S8I687_MUSBA|nr:hypothetical protein C4D60_Mb00t01240 [Musa balbisiana]